MGFNRCLSTISFDDAARAIAVTVFGAVADPVTVTVARAVVVADTVAVQDGVAYAVIDAVVPSSVLELEAYLICGGCGRHSYRPADQNGYTERHHDPGLAESLLS